MQATDHLLLLWLGPVFAFFMAFAGLMGSYFAELFPTQLRATGAGFCFNVGRGISAFAPLLLGSMSATFGFGRASRLRRRVHDRRRRGAAAARRQDCRRRRTRRRALSPAAATLPNTNRNSAMTRRFVDLSIYLENDVVSDPPAFKPEIQYFTHEHTISQIEPSSPA